MNMNKKLIYKAIFVFLPVSAFILGWACAANFLRSAFLIIGGWQLGRWAGYFFAWWYDQYVEVF